MKKIILVMCVVALLVCPVTAAGYSGGAGTEASPYQIETETDLNTLAASPDDWASHFVVMNDITFTAASTNTIGKGNTYDEDWVIIEEGVPFEGVFDGNRKTISNFEIDKTVSESIGLFGVVGENGKILGLTVNSSDFGVHGGSNVGILVGANSGNILNCYSTGDAIGDGSVGGLVGICEEGGTITNCHATASVTTLSGIIAGGLVGLNFGSITNCYATGNATVEYDYAGGLVGLNIGSITNCYATGIATGGDTIGGLVGENSGSITNCYATGIATGGDAIGGLVGSNYGTITNCYRFSDSGETKDGILITDLSKFKDIDWLTGTTPNDGLNWSADIISTEADDTKIWFVKSDKSVYPMFQWQSDDEPVTKYSGGEGTEASPYQITTEDDLNDLAATSGDWDKYFIVMNDIAFTAESTNTIGTGTTKFTGNFNGNGQTISNFEIDKSGSNTIGLFGQLGSGGEIKGLAVNAGDAGVHGGYNVGILVGANSGNILNCYSTGDAIGVGSVGGLVGANIGSITNCYATGNVTANSYAGGLVGSHAGGTITNCYATGNATATTNAGGLVGRNNEGTITNGYRVQSTGTDVGTIISDLSKFKDIDWLTGTTTNDGLKWSENIISTEKDDTKIWGVDPSKAFYPVFQHQYTPATPTPTPTPTPTQKPPVVHNRDRRAMATPSTYEIDESGYNMLLSSLELDQEFNSTTKEGELHPRGVFDASVFPFTGGAFGEYAAFLIFAIPFVLAWMRQNSAIIPMSFGCVLGTWMLWKLPAEWQLPATGMIVLSMMAILYGVYKEKY